MNEEGLELGMSMGVSGAFLRDESRFSEIHELFAEYCHLNSQLSESEYKLRSCNDPHWLVSFENQCQRLNIDPKLELVRKAVALEAKKAKLLEQLRVVKQKLLVLEPTVLDARQTLAGAAAMYLCSSSRLAPRKETDVAVAARNAVIDGLLNLSNLGICKSLDDEFPKQGSRPAPQFVDSWYRDHGAVCFEEAYRKCPKLVNNMIWKRRKRQSP